MYQQFFNFSTAPFSIAPDPHFIYMSQQHQEGLAHLLYGINQGGGFVALTGEVGTGKTTLCNCLLGRLPKDVDIALILNPKLSANELLASICDELNISYDKEFSSLKELIDELNAHLLATHANNRKTVVLIDEAQNLSLDVLEQVRLLTNLETVKTKLLQIILVGQPELKKILENPELRQLNQRITARYHLKPLSLAETQKYIKHRLKICGGNTNIFNRSATKKVYKLSKGIPRLINVICDRSLLGAYVENTEFVTTDIIDKAVKEVLSPSQSFLKDHAFKILSGLVLLISYLFLSYFFINYLSENNDVPALALEEKAEEENKVEKVKIEEVQIKNTKDEENNQQFSSLDFIQKPIQKTRENLTNEPRVLPEPTDFISHIKHQNISLFSGIARLALLWKKTIPRDTQCKELEEEGLNCLFGQSSWEKLITLNRPVIMEFPISETEKKYALLLKIKNGNPVFQFNGDKVFSIDEVLDLWEGYYVILWQPQTKKIETVYPGWSFSGVKWIKKQILINNPKAMLSDDSNYYGEALKTEVMKFQKQHYLMPDGIVGANTFIYLQNNDPLDNSPKLSSVR
ncbi:MAG: AAA family ATPase [Methylococcaceae bacterium]